MTSDATFTPDELAQGEGWPTLGPAYFAARTAAEKCMAAFEAEHFKPMLEKFADEFRGRLWGDVETFLLSDVECNLQGSLWRMVDSVTNALLTGEKWALERYVVSGERIGEAVKVRAAIVEHCGAQLRDQRIEDLEKQVADLKQSLEWARRL